MIILCRELKKLFSFMIEQFGFGYVIYLIDYYFNVDHVKNA